MLAYSTTNTPEDGPILSNPAGTRPILPVDVTLSGLKGVALLRHSKLATDKNAPRQHRNLDTQQTLFGQVEVSLLPPFTV